LSSELVVQNLIASNCAEEDPANIHIRIKKKTHTHKPLEEALSQCKFKSSGFKFKKEREKRDI
jgi:hypothetical protein